MLTVQGNRLGATLRMDAPFGTDPLAFDRTAVSYLTADEAVTGSVLVIFTDENSSNIRRSYSEHVAAPRTERDTAGMPLRDVWMVISEVWMKCRCTNPLCCSEEPLDAITTSTGNAARTAQELAGAFQHPTARDCLMTDVITSAPDQFTAVMPGVFPTRPDWARVDTAQEVAFELMKATPEGQRAPMLCLIGWLEWLKGKPSFAARYFKLALEDATDYRLAVLLAELVNRGLVADCASNPEKSYARPRNRRESCIRTNAET